MKVQLGFIIGFILGMLLMKFQMDSTPYQFDVVLQEPVYDDFSKQCFSVEVDADILIQKHIKDLSDNVLCIKYLTQDQRMYSKDHLKGQVIWDKETLFIKELIVNKVNGQYRIIKLESR